MFDIDQFIDSCESMKINELDIGDEGFFKNLFSGFKSKDNSSAKQKSGKNTHGRKIPTTPEVERAFELKKREYDKAIKGIIRNIKKKYKHLKFEPDFFPEESCEMFADCDYAECYFIYELFSETPMNMDIDDDALYDIMVNEYYDAMDEISKQTEDVFPELSASVDTGDGDEGCLYITFNLPL